MDLTMKGLNALAGRIEPNSNSPEVHVQPIQARLQSHPAPDPYRFQNTPFYKPYLAREQQKKMTGGDHIAPGSFGAPTSASTSTPAALHHRDNYHPYSRNGNNFQPQPRLKLSNPDENGRSIRNRESAQVTTIPRYHDTSKFGKYIPIIRKNPECDFSRLTSAYSFATPNFATQHPFHQPSSKSPPGYLNNYIPKQYGSMGAINGHRRPPVSYGLPAMPPPPAPRPSPPPAPRPSPPPYSQALRMQQPKTKIMRDGDELADKIETIDEQEIKITSTENCCSISIIPVNANLQRSEIDRSEVRSMLRTVLSFRYNIDLVERVEIRMTSLTQKIPDWELFVKQGRPLNQFYVQRIKQSKKDYFLEQLRCSFRKIYLDKKETFNCWAGHSAPCLYESSTDDICHVHFKGTEKQRRHKLKQIVDRQFSAILKFVIGKDFVGVVTDPQKFRQDFSGDVYYYLTDEKVNEILANLIDFEISQFLCEELQQIQY